MPQRQRSHAQRARQRRRAGGRPVRWELPSVPASAAGSDRRCRWGQCLQTGRPAGRRAGQRDRLQLLWAVAAGRRRRPHRRCEAAATSAAATGALRAWVRVARPIPAAAASRPGCVPPGCVRAAAQAQSARHRRHSCARRAAGFRRPRQGPHPCRAPPTPMRHAKRRSPAFGVGEPPGATPPRPRPVRARRAHDPSSRHAAAAAAAASWADADAPWAWPRRRLQLARPVPKKPPMRALRPPRWHPRWQLPASATSAAHGDPPPRTPALPRTGCCSHRPRRLQGSRGSWPGTAAAAARPLPAVRPLQKAAPRVT